MSSRRLAISAILALACTRSLDGQGTVFSSRIDVVRVNVLVTDRGQAVRGLQRQDFEIRDDGVLQDIDLVSVEEIGANVVLGFDVSASVSGERLSNLQFAGRALLDQMGARDRAALLTFSHAVLLRQPLTSDIGQVRTALAAVTTGGLTALVDGSQAAIAVAGAVDGPSLLLLFSDGLDTASWLTSDAVLQSARRSDAVVSGVAVRGPSAPRFLRDLSAATGGSVVEVESTRDLSQTFLRILAEFRQRYLLFYTPRGVAPGGFHRIDVRVKSRRGTVRARAGYEAGTTEESSVR
jgi:VWFA-related protein